MGEINKVRIEASEDDLQSWAWLLELMHNKGLITIIQMFAESVQAHVDATQSHIDSTKEFQRGLQAHLDQIK